MSYFAQQFLNGIQLGTIYALIALGYTMVYGIIKLINFAHADIFMVGAYAAFFIVAYMTGVSADVPLQMSIWPAVIIAYLLLGLIARKTPALRLLFDAAGTKRPSSGNRSDTGGFRFPATVAAKLALQVAILVLLTALIAPLLLIITRFIFKLRLSWMSIPAILLYVMTACALLGCAMEKIAYRPLRHKPRLSSLITAMGVSFFLENFCSLDLMFGNKYQAFPLLVKKIDVLRIDALGVSVNNIFLINITVLAVMLAVLWYLVEKTLIGKQMRAVAFDVKTASLMGIDVNRVIAFTFMVGPALAGVSGVLYAMNYGVLQSPFLGFFPGLKAFIAAVLGGIGSLPGAVIGAFLMGTTEVFANAINSNLGFAAAFMVLIVILLIKPTGLLGRKEIEKV